MQLHYGCNLNSTVMYLPFIYIILYIKCHIIVDYNHCLRPYIPLQPNLMSQMIPNYIIHVIQCYQKGNSTIKKAFAKSILLKYYKSSQIRLYGEWFVSTKQLVFILLLPVVHFKKNLVCDNRNGTVKSYNGEFFFSNL